MELKITIDMDNAAFDDDPGHEAARILTKLASRIAESGIVASVGDGITLRDINGNRVGEAVIDD